MFDINLKISCFYKEMHNSYVHEIMTGELNILFFTTTFLVFHLTYSQPSTSNSTWATLQAHCRSGNGSQIRLNKSNNSGLQTGLLIRPMWSSVDGNYTRWIAYLGCFEITSIPIGLRKHEENIILNNTVERCYLVCQKENISCEQNEPVYFALKESVCFCVCKIEGILAQSDKCNESCSSDGACHSDDHFNVYTKYIHDYERSDKFCMVCSKVDTNLKAKFSFGCNEDPFGLCVERGDLCFKEDGGKSNSSRIDCAQKLPLVCLKNNDDSKIEVTLTTTVLSPELNSTSVVPEDTLTTTDISSELSSKHSYEISSSTPFLKSFTSFDKAMESNNDIVGVIVSLFVAIFALTSLFLLFWYYKTRCKVKHRDSQIDLHQQQTSQIINNTYTDMTLVPGTNRNQHDVVLATVTNSVCNDMTLVSGTNWNQNDDVLTTTTNDVPNDDIYVENEEGEYGRLHSSRPKQGASEREDERYATSTDLEDVPYSTDRKSRNSVPDCNNEYDNMAASLDNNFRSVANPDYEFWYQSRQRKDC